MTFAEVAAEVVKTPPGTPWWVTVGIGALGLAGGWLYKVYQTERQRKRAEQMEDEEKERKHQKEDVNEVIKGKDDIIERLKAANAEDKRAYASQMQDMRQEVAQLRAKLEACVVRQQKAEKLAIRYEMRIQHLEEILEGRGIPFKKLKDDDSATLAALPTTPPEKEPF